MKALQVGADYNGFANAVPSSIWSPDITSQCVVGKHKGSDRMT